MVMTDPIADMLTRIRNANSVHHDKVEIPGSKIKVAIAEILKAEGLAQARLVEAEAEKEAIRRITAECPDVLVGAGTVLTKEQAEYNQYAPILMTSVDTDPKLCLEERKAIMQRLGVGQWQIFGAHGFKKDYSVN